MLKAVKFCEYTIFQKLVCLFPYSKSITLFQDLSLVHSGQLSSSNEFLVPSCR